MTIAASTPTSPPRLARLAVSVMFFVFGINVVTFSLYIPTLKLRLELSDAALGSVGFVGSLGSITATLLSAWFMGRFGSRTLTIIAAVGFSLLLPVLIFAPSVPLAVLIWLFFGACAGAMDVAMNTQGVLVERQYDRVLMSNFHGMFSIGAVTGTVVGTIIASVGIGPLPHTLAILPIQLMLALLAGRFLLPEGKQKHEVTTERPPLIPRNGMMLLFGLMVLLAFLSEITVSDWGAVYLRVDLGASQQLTAIGLFAFSVGMLISRLSGDALVERFGPAFIIRVSTLIAAVGLGISLIVGTANAAVVGYFFAGVGAGNLIPIILSAGSRLPGLSSEQSMSGVLTFGYTAFLAGPLLIGYTAQATSLRVAMGLVVGFCIAIALLAGFTGGSTTES